MGSPSELGRKGCFACSVQHLILEGDLWASDSEAAYRGGLLTAELLPFNCVAAELCVFLRRS